MTGPLLIVAHEGTRTGSPRVLLELLRVTAGRIDAPIAVHLQAEGPLSADLRSFATIDRHSETPAALLVNSAAAAAAIDDVPAGTPSTLYVHEEGDALAVLPSASRDALTRFDRVLCVSERSRDSLADLGVETSIIEILPPVVRHGAASLSGPSQPATIIGCGEAGWRKGADLFIDTARRIMEHSDAQFVWAGRRPRSFARLLDRDTEAAGLTDRLVWLGEVDDVAPLFDAASLLLMTSREDPQPLVPLEAAGHGVATAGFAIGGITDLSAARAAVTVPFPDTVELAEVAVGLLADSDQREALVSAASDWARSRHSIDVVGERFLSVIDEMLGR